MKNFTFLFLTGISGTGKGWFWDNILKPTGKFQKLVSATSRGPREGEIDGAHYYFRDEKFFDREKFAVKLFVNQAFWKPGDPKWLYGVTEAEVLRNAGKNLVYDVIEPKYVRRMIDWCRENNLRYNFRIAYFLSPEQSLAIADKRKNMPNDIKVRSMNTCDPADFLDAGAHPDWFMLSRADKTLFDRRCLEFISRVR